MKTLKIEDVLIGNMVLKKVKDNQLTHTFHGVIRGMFNLLL